jgi:Protein involved in biosynthesis of mitomycin antibiotics/polyketide fumonisin
MLTQEQIDFFHTNGYLIMRAMLCGEELRALQEAADHVIAEGVARIDPQYHRYMAGADGREVYWRSEEVWPRGDVWKAVTLQPDLLENIGQCIGQAFYQWNDSLVVKLPDNGAPVLWHQDPPYRNADRETVYPVPNFTTDLYLDHSGPDNGCVYAIPRHHLAGNVDLTGKSQQDLFEKYGAVPLELEAGDVLFHCLSTPHGSGGNISGRMRRIFYIHYLAEEVYQDGYASEPWAAQKPGLVPERRALIEEMLAARRRFGWEDPLSRPTLSWGVDGFAVSGGPMTPARYWERLTSTISEERRVAMKTLADVALRK